MSRGGPKITRSGKDYETSEMPNWLGRFADTLDSKGRPKNAVEVARLRDQGAQDYSILNQISNLVSNKPVHATVDSKVEELCERTGLNAYLKQLSASDDGGKKDLKVQADDDPIQIKINLPESLAKYKNCAEDIANYIKNTIENLHGMGATIPQMQHDVLHTFSRRHGIVVQDIMNDDVAKYINDCIISAQSSIAPEAHTPHIGAGVGRTEPDDDDDKDAFSILMPATE